MAALEQEGYLQPAAHERRPRPHRQGLPLLRRLARADRGRSTAVRRPAGAHVLRQAHGALEQMLHDTSRLLPTSPTTPPSSSGRRTRRRRPLGPARRARAARVVLASRCSRTASSRSARSSSTDDTGDESSRRRRPSWPRSWSARSASSRWRRCPATGDQRGRRTGRRRATALAELDDDTRPDHVFVGGASRMAERLRRRRDRAPGPRASSSSSTSS